MPPKSAPARRKAKPLETGFVVGLFYLRIQSDPDRPPIGQCGWIEDCETVEDVFDDLIKDGMILFQNYRWRNDGVRRVLCGKVSTVLHKDTVKTVAQYVGPEFEEE